MAILSTCTAQRPQRDWADRRQQPQDNRHLPQVLWTQVTKEKRSRRQTQHYIPLLKQLHSHFKALQFTQGDRRRTESHRASLDKENFKKQLQHSALVSQGGLHKRMPASDKREDTTVSKRTPCGVIHTYTTELSKSETHTTDTSPRMRHRPLPHLGLAGPMHIRHSWRSPVVQCTDTMATVTFTGHPHHRQTHTINMGQGGGAGVYKYFIKIIVHRKYPLHSHK